MDLEEALSLSRWCVPLLLVVSLLTVAHKWASSPKIDPTGPLYVVAAGLYYVSSVFGSVSVGIIGFIVLALTFVRIPALEAIACKPFPP